MSEQPKKRPWLQFSLATAIVMMFVASGLLWLNLRPLLTYPRGSVTSWEDFPVQQLALLNWQANQHLGWPTTAYDWILQRPFVNVDIYAPQLHPLGLTCDIASAVLILLLVAFLCEWLIRRRERRP
jgi:hypothetical protein